MVPNSVDKEGWRSRHTVAFSVAEILFDASSSFDAFKIAMERLHVEPKLGCNFEGLFLAERRLAPVQPIMHFPKATLCGGGFGDPGDKRSSGMSAFVWKVTEGVSETFTEHLAQAVKHWAKRSAVGAENEVREDPCSAPRDLHSNPSIGVGPRGYFRRCTGCARPLGEMIASAEHRMK